MKRFDDFVKQILADAGWFSDRRADVSNWKAELKASDNMEMFSKAERILIEFGGIKVERSKNYSGHTFEINPSLAICEGDRFEEYSTFLNTKLYPLGEVYDGYFFLAVAEDGRIFWLMDNLFIMANSFEEALTKIMLGLHPEFCK